MSVIKSITDAFPVSVREASLLIATAPSRYKVHLIEKRHGRGMRVIAQPTAEIKALQRALLDKYVSTLPVSDSVTAYRKDFGIVDHASAHAPHRYLLKLDFKDFFPSITGADFLKHVKKYSDISPEDAKLLARLFFWCPKGEQKLRLSIGAPSSPAISNTILYDFDTELVKFCGEHHVTYTRYADDLAFSTSEAGVLTQVHKFVEGLCSRQQYPKLELNIDKTVFTSKKHRRQLTGLVLSNEGKASLGRDKKRLIRAMADRYKKGVLSAEDLGTLRGWVAFSISVDKVLVDSLQRMLGTEKFYELMHPY